MFIEKRRFFIVLTPTLALLLNNLKYSVYNDILLNNSTFSSIEGIIRKTHDFHIFIERLGKKQFERPCLRISVWFDGVRFKDTSAIDL